jgi:tRNA (mo5U34)-methyltransferase
MDIAAKQAELDAVTWYHEFDFGNGLRTRTHCHHIESHRQVWTLVEEHLATVDFRGKTVLDIGAWDGYWSFYAEKRGARAVLASDDLGQNWSQGRGIHLAKELLGSSIEIDQNLSVYNLAARGRKFDVILFLGVYYHLHDPFHALAQIRHCCHPGTVIVIDGPVAVNLAPNTALVDYSNHSCEWLPTVEALEQMLKATYFTSSVAGMLAPPALPAPGRLGWRWRLRTALSALAGNRTVLEERVNGVINRSPAYNRRALLKCAPHEGEVDLHYYRPPFGLHAYDPRFRDTPARRAA